MSEGYEDVVNFAHTIDNKILLSASYQPINIRKSKQSAISPPKIVKLVIPSGIPALETVEDKQELSEAINIIKKNIETTKYEDIKVPLLRRWYEDIFGKKANLKFKKKDLYDMISAAVDAKIK